MSLGERTAEYNPEFKANTKGKAYCTKCKNELSERDKSGFGWYCSECKHLIITKPPYHETEILGYNYVLLKDNYNKSLKYPGGFLKLYCPICEKPMFIDKIFLNPTGECVERDKFSLSLGYVCADWKNCGYTQPLRLFIPKKEIYSLINIKP